MVKLKANDPLNLRAYRAVKNFNEKQRRVERSGKGYAPDRVSIKEIKSRYTKRSDLLRVVRQLEKFNQMGRRAYDVIENQGGGRTNRWRYEYTKANLNRARKYWQQRLAYQMAEVGSKIYSENGTGTESTSFRLSLLHESHLGCDGESWLQR